MKGFVPISAQELKKVAKISIENIIYYKGDLDTTSTHQEFQMRKMKTVTKFYTDQPAWALYKKTTVGILRGLIETAEEVMNDSKLEDKTIMLSMLSHKGLYQIYNRSTDFNIYHFRDY